MTLSTFIKRVSVACGLYRPTRWLARRIRREELREFELDVKLYRSLIPPGGLCFDVGANIGAKSEAMLEAGARVVAFEPSPLVIEELKARCAPYPRWTLMASAVGSRAEIATLHARATHEQSSLAREWEGTIVGEFEVPVLTLDLAIEHFGQPFFCKIDVEGWELEVLKGLGSSIPLVSLEFHLTPDDIQKTKLCLRRLLELGDGWVNLTPAETAAFHLGEWLPLSDFVEWFPGDLAQTLPSAHYGDIFVRSEPHGRDAFSGSVQCS